MEDLDYSYKLTQLKHLSKNQYDIEIILKTIHTWSKHNNNQTILTLYLTELINYNTSFFEHILDNPDFEFIITHNDVTCLQNILTKLHDDVLDNCFKYIMETRAEFWKQKEHKKWIDKQLKFKEERAFMNTIIDDSKKHLKEKFTQILIEVYFSIY